MCHCHFSLTASLRAFRKETELAMADKANLDRKRFSKQFNKIWRRFKFFKICSTCELLRTLAVKVRPNYPECEVVPLF